MAAILSKGTCDQIKKLNREFSSFSDKGWMSEGSDAFPDVCGVLFNNDTDEAFWFSYSGKIILDDAPKTSESDKIQMAKIQATIRRLCDF